MTTFNEINRKKKKKEKQQQQQSGQQMTTQNTHLLSAHNQIVHINP